jgi:hypothetical protein
MINEGKTCYSGREQLICLIDKDFQKGLKLDLVDISWSGRERKLQACRRVGTRYI